MITQDILIGDNTKTQLLKAYQDIRAHSVSICAPLKAEDYVVQPIADVSPPKWHLGHTTWFFETFILKAYVEDYAEFDPDYNFVFNSYYETVGARVLRTDRGNLSRPSVDDVLAYRKYVDMAMTDFLQNDEAIENQLIDLLLLGLNHEQQHQELLVTDIKYILGHNPLQPAYDASLHKKKNSTSVAEWILIEEGVYEIGFNGNGFCFDNELGRHKTYIHPFAINAALVSNADYLEFIKDSGYADFRHWHSEGWEWVKANAITAPLYWQLIDGNWYNYTLKGLQLLDLTEPVCHLSYYEAAAFAAWAGKRLPTEQEWEVANRYFNWGERWEWTESAYLPYPGFSKAPGAIGEYNGKFMVSQMVLRGASEATPAGHSRHTYRNFFHPHLRWQYSGIRLAKSL